MELTYLVVFSTIAAVYLLLGLLLFFVLWSRLNSVDEQIDVLEDQVPAEQVTRAVAIAEGSADRVDNAVTALGKFREGIHSEVQRLYGIMRRQEKSADRLEAAQQEPEDEVPTEIDPAQLQSKEEEPSKEMSKAQLRELARKRGVQV